MVSTPAGWYGDPMGRFEHRYWDGTAWTDHVARNGVQSSDPLHAPTSPTPVVEAVVPATAAAPQPTPPQPTTPQPVASEPIASEPVGGTTTAATAAAPEAWKVCPHCATQSITSAATCPSCGKKYAKTAKWPWVVAALFVVMVLGIGGCIIAVSTVAVKAVDELNVEQARHAITQSQFDAVRLGTPRAAVVVQLGKAPEDAQEFISRGVANGDEIKSSCIYYNRVGELFGRRYQFCFEGNILRSKNTF